MLDEWRNKGQRALRIFAAGLTRDTGLGKSVEDIREASLQQQLAILEVLIKRGAPDIGLVTQRLHINLLPRALSQHSQQSGAKRVAGSLGTAVHDTKYIDGICAIANADATSVRKRTNLTTPQPNDSNDSPMMLT